MNIAQITALALGATVAEGFVLARLPGADPLFAVTRTPANAALSGIFVTLAMVLATAAAWPVGYLLNSRSAGHLQVLLYVCVICGIAALFDLAIKKLPGFLKRLPRALPLPPQNLAVNSAVMGAAVIYTGSGAGFLDAVAGAAAAGAGFLVVGVLFAGVRGRVVLTSNCPKAMEGLPIALVTAGLLALAFSGFSGLKIA